VREESRPAAGTLSDALRMGRKRLASSHSDSPGLDAEVLLRHVLGLDRAALFAQLREPMATAAFAQYQRLLDERDRDIPVAYLIGEREFMGFSFEVGPGVLVPRPETEVLMRIDPARPLSMSEPDREPSPSVSPR
jgi:release factor glutamine methyltransferase